MCCFESGNWVLSAGESEYNFPQLMLSVSEWVAATVVCVRVCVCLCVLRLQLRGGDILFLSPSVPARIVPHVSPCPARGTDRSRSGPVGVLADVAHGPPSSFATAKTCQQHSKQHHIRLPTLTFQKQPRCFSQEGEGFWYRQCSLHSHCGRIPIIKVLIKFPKGLSINESGWTLWIRFRAVELK